MKPVDKIKLRVHTRLSKCTGMRQTIRRIHRCARTARCPLTQDSGALLPVLMSTTLLVLQALQIWGTNFNYMATRINTRMAAMGLPSNNRSHRQVKLKYKREEKAHPKKVTAAINGQVRLCDASRRLHRGCVHDWAAKCLLLQCLWFVVLG